MCKWVKPHVGKMYIPLIFIIYILTSKQCCENVQYCFSFQNSEVMSHPQYKIISFHHHGFMIKASNSMIMIKVSNFGKPKTCQKLPNLINLSICQINRTLKILSLVEIMGQGKEKEVIDYFHIVLTQIQTELYVKKINLQQMYLITIKKEKNCQAREWADYSSIWFFRLNSKRPNSASLKFDNTTI